MAYDRQIPPIRVADAMLARLQVLTDREGLSLSSFIRKLLEEGMQRRKGV